MKRKAPRMFDVNAVELVVLGVWAVGVVAALYATHEAPLLSRVLVLALVLLFPLVGSLATFALALARLRRRRAIAPGGAAA